MKKRILMVPLNFRSLALFLVILSIVTWIFFHLTSNVIAKYFGLIEEDNRSTQSRIVAQKFELEIRSRMDALMGIIPNLYSTGTSANSSPKLKMEAGLYNPLVNELIRARIYRKDENKLVLIREYRHLPFLEKKQLVEHDLNLIDITHPLTVNDFLAYRRPALFNRSVHIVRDKFQTDLTVLTLIFPVSFVGSQSKSLFCAVDISEDLLQKGLDAGGFYQTFLIKKDGTLLIHTQTQSTMAYSKKSYLPHFEQTVDSLWRSGAPVEFKIASESYLSAFSPSGFPEIYGGVQQNEQTVHSGFYYLRIQLIVVGLLIVSVTAFLSVILAMFMASRQQALEAKR